MIGRGIPITGRLEGEHRLHRLGSDDAVPVRPAEEAEDAGDVRRSVDDTDADRTADMLTSMICTRNGGTASLLQPRSSGGGQA